MLCWSCFPCCACCFRPTPDLPSLCVSIPRSSKHAHPLHVVATATTTLYVSVSAHAPRKELCAILWVQYGMCRCLYSVHTSIQTGTANALHPAQVIKMLAGPLRSADRGLKPASRGWAAVVGQPLAALQWPPQLPIAPLLPALTQPSSVLLLQVTCLLIGIVQPAKTRDSHPLWDVLTPFPTMLIHNSRTWGGMCEARKTTCN